MTPGVQKGVSHEAFASQWLRKRGYIILGRNRQIGNTEVDILALNPNSENTYHFVEIKTVKAQNFYSGYPPWNARQAARYHKAIYAWYSELGKAVPVRISLLLVDPEDGVLRFYPDYHYPMAS